MSAVFKLIGGGVAAVVMGIMLYQVPDLAWYHPLPAFAVAPLLIGMGIVHWRNLQKKNHEGAAVDPPKP
jgi:hypothetical protein